MKVLQFIKELCKTAILGIITVLLVMCVIYVYWEYVRPWI